MTGRHVWTALAAAAAIAAGASAADRAENYKIQKSDFAVVCKTREDKPIVRYVFATPPKDEPQTSVPAVGYLHPIHTPSGQVITESRGGDHAWLRGVFWAWPQVEAQTADGKTRAGFWTCGQAVWKEKGQIVNQEVKTDADGDAARLAAVNRWTDGQADLLLEHTQLTAFEVRGVYVIDLSVRLEAAAGPVSLLPWAFTGLTFHGRRIPGETV